MIFLFKTMCQILTKLNIFFSYACFILFYNKMRSFLTCSQVKISISFADVTAPLVFFEQC